MVIHTLWNCKGASDVWTSSNLPIQQWSNSLPSMNQLWNLWMEKFELDELAMATTIMQIIWHYENSVIFKNTFRAPPIYITNCD